MSHINYNEVSFSCGGNEILTSINLQLKQGELLAILGENGAGKTTLVKLLTGLIRPTKGKIMINQTDISSETIAQLARQVGYVFQNPMDQIFHHTIFDEVVFGMKQLKKQIDLERVDEVLSLTGLEDYRDTNPYELPFSMMKFVTIASILCMDTDIVIFDEPTAGQDYYGKMILTNILNYLREKEKTVIVISHDLEFVAEQLATCLVLSKGEIIVKDRTSHLFWDFETLKKSGLQQPLVSDLANALQLQSHPVTVSDFIEECKK